MKTAVVLFAIAVALALQTTLARFAVGSQSMVDLVLVAVVYAALANSPRIEARTGWTIKKFVRALRRYRTVKINTGSHTLAAEDPPPDDVRQALAAIHQGAH